MQDNIAIGLNANLHPTIKLNRGGSIDYPSGNRLEYSRAPGRNGNFFFDYYHNGNQTRLNDFVASDNWVFLPVESGFFIRLREDGEKKPYPEVQISVPQLENEVSLLDAFHEKGHANILDFVKSAINDAEDPASLQAKLQGNLSGYDIPELNQVPQLYGSQTSQMIQVFEFLQKALGDSEFHSISERLAWAYALRTNKRHGILSHIDNETIFNHYDKYRDNFSKV